MHAIYSGLTISITEHNNSNVAYTDVYNGNKQTLVEMCVIAPFRFDIGSVHACLYIHCNRSPCHVYTINLSISWGELYHKITNYSNGISVNTLRYEMWISCQFQTYRLRVKFKF